MITLLEGPTRDDAESCPCCSARAFERHKLDLLRCAACGIIISPLIWRAGVNEEMEEAWFADGEADRRSFWVRAFEASNNRRTLRRLRRAGKSRGRLLEVGIGSGSFLANARAKGFDPLGCDLSTGVCEVARQTFGVSVHCGPLDSIDGTFDVIVMNHVIEHVTEPTAFIRKALRLLAQDGLVHIAVPNAACWEAVLRGWTSYEPYHLTYFERETLARVISDAGGRILFSEHIESFSGWFLALLRTLRGVNRDGTIARAPAGRRTSLSAKAKTVEHAYRLAMCLSGALTAPFRYVQAKLGAGDELVMLVVPGARPGGRDDRPHFGAEPTPP